MTIIQIHFLAIRNFISMLNSYKKQLCVFFLKTYISLLLFFFDKGKKIVTNFPSTRLVDENIKANTEQKSWA